MLEFTKQNHWRDWLEQAMEPDIWTVNKVIAASASDGVKARVLALIYKQGNEEKMATTNTEKAQILAKSFFPPKLADTGIPEDFPYPNACCRADQITKEQIQHHLRKLKPYKAPGPDGIPNIVLTKCANLLTNRLYYIYKAILDGRLHYTPWKEFHCTNLGSHGMTLPKHTDQ